MTTRLLNSQDFEMLEEYLTPHKSVCMFILSNLNSAGIEYHGMSFQGEYFGHFDDVFGKIDGVIVHYHSGNIMMHASNKTILRKLITHLRRNIKRPITGVLGDNKQAIYVLDKLGITNEAFSINDREVLYEINLEKLDIPDMPENCAIVSTKDVSRDLLIEWMKDYDIESLGTPNDSSLEQRAIDDVNRRLTDNNSWVLLSDGVPVSLSAFHSRLEDFIQVGPVWTPPEHRNKGFAKLLLIQTLAIEKNKGLKKAFLFTDLPAAMKAYISVGFRRIGYYRFALLEKAVKIDPQMIQIRDITKEDITLLTSSFKAANWHKPKSLFQKYLNESQLNERHVWLAFMQGEFAGYITLQWNSSYEYFKTLLIPEIMDLNVLPEYRKMGLASMLMDTAEKEASTKSDTLGIGVGLYAGSDGGYGAAQRIYVKRGYVPDGKGITYNYQPVTPGKSYQVDDDLVLWFTKKLG